MNIQQFGPVVRGLAFAASLSAIAGTAQAQAELAPHLSWPSTHAYHLSGSSEMAAPRRESPRTDGWADCDPYWTRVQRADTLWMAIVTVGMGDTPDEALRRADGGFPEALATKASAYVHGQVGLNTLMVDVGAFAAGSVSVQHSDLCKVDGRWKVWTRTDVPVRAYEILVQKANPSMLKFDLIGILRQEMQRHPTPTKASLLWTSLYSPGAVQRASGRETWGGFILGAVVGGAAVGVTGLIGAKYASAQARAETTSQIRRDHYTNVSNEWSRTSQGGWMLAGAFYFVGALQGMSTNPGSVAAWRIFHRTMLTVGVR